MANEIKGEELLLKYDGKLVARAQSYSLEVSKESIDVTTLYSGDWNESISGRKSWTVSTDGLVSRPASGGTETDYNSLLDDLVNTSTPVTIILSSEVEGDKYYEGDVIINSLSLSGSNGEVATFSASFTGTGALEIKTVE